MWSWFGKGNQYVYQKRCRLTLNVHIYTVSWCHNGKRYYKNVAIIRICCQKSICGFTLCYGFGKPKSKSETGKTLATSDFGKLIYPRTYIYQLIHGTLVAEQHCNVVIAVNWCAAGHVRKPTETLTERCQICQYDRK